jgi:hypothetical protein
MNQGKLLQASLEVYAPLTDAQFRPDSPVENRAQSMSVVKPGSARITHVEDSASQTQ